MAETNIHEVINWMRVFVDRIDFTMPGPSGRSLGDDIAKAVVAAIQGRAAMEETPDGKRWPPNSRDYAAEKQKQYGWIKTNYRTAQMLSAESLYGRTQITPDEVNMIYGTGQPPTGSHAPTGYLSPGDRRTTDDEKAYYAHEQGREFYGLSDRDAEMITGLIEDAVAGAIGFGADMPVLD